MDVRELLESVAERGNPAGADEVVRRAVAEAADHAVVPLAAPRPRRWVRAAVAITASAAVVAGAVAGGGLLYARAKLGDIERVDLSAALTGAASPSEPMTVLLVGSDSRGGLSQEDMARFGSPDAVGAERADTIMVVRLDPAAGTAAVLSLPRDLWVAIDGGPEQRLNTALGSGADALVRTVEAIVGLGIDHYVQVDFDGFRRVVDAIGGVAVRFPAPARDRVSGLDVPEAGCRVLDGEEALALVRGRHLQELVDGRWVADPRGDLGRIARQQRFLLDVLADAAATRHPLTVRRLLDAAADHVVIDDGLSSGDLVDLGREVGSVVAAGVRFVDVPVANARVGGAAVLRAEPGDLRAAGNALLAPSPATPAAPAGPVTVEPPCDK